MQKCKYPRPLHEHLRGASSQKNNHAGACLTPLENGKPRSGLSAAARNLKSNEGLGDYGRAAQETAKLASSIWKRATCPSTMVKVIAKGDSTIFPVAFSPREATANAA
jgi:hypothetical protein